MKALTKLVRKLTSSVDQRVDWLALWEVVAALDRALMRVLTGAKRALGRDPCKEQNWKIGGPLKRSPCNQKSLTTSWT